MAEQLGDVKHVHPGIEADRRERAVGPAIEDGERMPNANEYEAICEFFGWPDARRRNGSLRSRRRP